MSVQSFGNYILDPRVKSLESQSSLSLTNITENVQYGRTYTHHINNPNAPNPNNYRFNVSETAPSGSANTDIITVSTIGGPPYTSTFLSFNATEINFNGLLNFTNNPATGTATLPVGAATSILVSGGLGLQNVVATSVIMITQASPNTGGTQVAIPIYVVAGTQNFTIFTDATLIVAVKLNWNIVKY